VLGFIGLPTLGYYLHSAFMECYYSDVGALLVLFYVLVGTVHLWARAGLLPLYLAGAWLVLPAGSEAFSLGNLTRVLTVDIVPAPLRGEPVEAEAVYRWLETVLVDQALPGAGATLVLTQIALVATGLVALAAFPLVSRLFLGPIGRRHGHTALVVARSTPEYMRTLMLLQLLGPSMLPAILALALHNGALIGHLVGHYTNSLALRPDRPRRRLDRYGFEVLPRAYGMFLAFTLYRWEVIMRETSILGMLGVATLGFYVDSAIQDIRFDRAALLIAVTALLNIALDLAARRIRSRLGLRMLVESS
jgi:phosphonate transport system permease protein